MHVKAILRRRQDLEHVCTDQSAKVDDDWVQEASRRGGSFPQPRLQAALCCAASFLLPPWRKAVPAAVLFATAARTDRSTNGSTNREPETTDRSIDRSTAAPQHRPQHQPQHLHYICGSVLLKLQAKDIDLDKLQTLLARELALRRTLLSEPPAVTPLGLAARLDSVCMQKRFRNADRISSTS